MYLSDRAREALIHRRDLREALRERKMIERKFGEAKWWHRMDRARYRGRWRVAIQALMTFMVLNVKRMARLLAERSLRNERQLAPTRA